MYIAVVAKDFLHSQRMSLFNTSRFATGCLRLITVNTPLSTCIMKALYTKEPTTVLYFFLLRFVRLRNHIWLRL